MADKIENEGDDDSRTRIKKKNNVRGSVTQTRNIREKRWSKIRKRRVNEEDVVNIPIRLIWMKCP